MKNTSENDRIIHEQQEILKGLKSKQKRIDCKYLYNEMGCTLFEKITDLDEYYLTRSEASIFDRYSKEICSYINQDTVILEPGAGNCTKIRHLLSNINPYAYMPQDISADFLQTSIQSIKHDYPDTLIVPITGDFNHGIDLPSKLRDKPLFIFYPGSTIGNMHPEQATQFLSEFHTSAEHVSILLGIDLIKDKATIEKAYNDLSGISATFNLNIIDHLNHVLNTKIEKSNFLHHAFYNEQQERIEMHLTSTLDQQYQILDEGILFKKGERIHTENSYKYSIEGIEKLANSAGFEITHSWTDNKNYFSLNYLTKKL